MVEETLGGLTQKFSTLVTVDPELAALKKLAGMVRREALVLAFSDVFLVIAVIFAPSFFTPFARSSHSSRITGMENSLM